jgi:hypothetical protein
MAQNMGSLPTKRHARLKDAVSWKKLTDSQRQEIYNEAAGLMDWATYLYNNLLDDYSSMISYWGDVNRLGKKWAYYTDEYKNLYWVDTTTTNTSPTAWNDWLNKSSDVFKPTTDIWWSRLPANFYQK